MSSDNGIYILVTKDGFRVVHTQAIDNIYYDADESGFNKYYLYHYFKDSDIYSSRDVAWKKAHKLYDEIMQDDFCPFVEYGISEIDATNIEFSLKAPKCCDDPDINNIGYGDYGCNNCGEFYLGD